MKKLLSLITLLFFIISCNSKSTLDEAKYNKLPDGLYALMKTNKGDMIIQLEMDKVPVTVANFVGLAEGKIENKAKKGNFYDGLTFHRVIDGFMIQGGDPQGTGNGGPGYEFPDEFDPSLLMDQKGIVAMANSGPNTNGSQFFITDTATPFLNGKHSVFGKVIEGLPVIDSIDTVEKDMGNKPTTPVVINSITIIRKGKNAKKFDAKKIFEGRDNAAMQSKAVTIGAKMQEETMAKLQAEFETKIKSFINDYKTKKAAIDQSSTKTPSGIQYLIIEEGKEPAYTNNQTAKVQYVLFDPNKSEGILDTSFARGAPFDVPVGQGAVIKGWDEILTTFKKGTKLYVKIPPELAYGNQAKGPLKANTTLYFYMEIQ